MPDATGKRWYLVQCKPRQALRAQENLERQGYQCLLPLHKIERLQKGQLQQLSEPLFPGYIFIHLDKVEDSWLPIRSTRGVNQIVNFGGYPTPVPDAVVAELQQPRKIPPALESGDRVVIRDSNLQQLDAIYLEYNGAGRVLLLLTLLQREIIIKAPLNRLEKLKS
ncbi:transcription/translation regulatory transformer protein RfaH [Pseudomonas citronellolis]|uniref:transcription/translation regulatory transformer protein RfaH n=1 Tax=Pseudomonas citronellolis TaxID=53408 RepID=UPI00071870A1|nr:transcription/translation regulatory transformer protein RfaH [Pseudomonas citronellolis]KRV75229.1 hypothetical protein AO742_14110 [Pseudomonas citronellolis]KRW78972.1 hypothetical protein AO738_14100 [Pseudomonas citronellolis]